MTVTAKVSLGSTAHVYGLAVEMIAEIPDMPRDQALELMQAAHQVCPYSNATRGNIEVSLTLA